MLTLTRWQFAKGHCLLTTGLWCAATVCEDHRSGAGWTPAAHSGMIDDLAGLDMTWVSKKNREP